MIVDTRTAWQTTITVSCSNGNGSCICPPAKYGPPSCEDICVNGKWNDEAKKCDCYDGNTGAYCDTPSFRNQQNAMVIGFAIMVLVVVFIFSVWRRRHRAAEERLRQRRQFTAIRRQLRQYTRPIMIEGGSEQPGVYKIPITPGFVPPLPSYDAAVQLPPQYTNDSTKPPTYEQMDVITLETEQEQEPSTSQATTGNNVRQKF